MLYYKFGIGITYRLDMIKVAVIFSIFAWWPPCGIQVASESNIPPFTRFASYGPLTVASPPKMVQNQR